ncbi:MAG: glycerol-3-phosphate acyltransferase [Faecousia sp.]
MIRMIEYMILGYLSGSVLYARVFSRVLGKDNVYEQSKDCNPGTANAFTYGGFWCGLGTLLGDLLKGAVPVWLYLRGASSSPSLALALVAAAPVFGHAFPVFYRFQGGKGIAATFGCLLGLLPVWQPLALFIGAFLLFSLVIRITPHFQRTIFSYLLTLICMLLTKQRPEIILGFLLITAIVCLRMHMSKEPRESMLVRLF